MITSSQTNLRRKRAWEQLAGQAAEAYLTSHTMRKLQLGSGTNVLDGWLNTDLVPASDAVVYLDTTRRFPFADATFDYVFSEHHLEHITYEEGLFALSECYRILKPGGRIRLATPNLGTLLGLYTPQPDERQQRYMRFIAEHFLPGISDPQPVFVINNAFRNWGHQFLYDRATLQQTLTHVGFLDICFLHPGESNHQPLCQLEMHGQFIGDEEINQFETMVVEARR